MNEETEEKPIDEEFEARKIFESETVANYMMSRLRKSLQKQSVKMECELAEVYCTMTIVNDNPFVKLGNTRNKKGGEQEVKRGMVKLALKTLLKVLRRIAAEWKTEPENLKMMLHFPDDTPELRIREINGERKIDLTW